MTSKKILVHFDALYAPHVEIVRAAVDATLRAGDVKSGQVTVVLTDEASLRALNLRYAGSDNATDVLSFSSMERDPESGLVHLGDVVIAVPVAESQAHTAGHSLEDELCLLAVHGALHLLGHDHASEADRHTMWSAQETILSEIGCNPTIPEE